VPDIKLLCASIDKVTAKLFLSEPTNIDFIFIELYSHDMVFNVKYKIVIMNIIIGYI